MANVYMIDGEGQTKPWDRVQCRDEARELQQILLHNPGLLAGDQIDPKRPREWLLVKREMPVPDPGSGSNRWSVDFLFGDQDAIPTFVECKRFRDTRARREVIGQTLEYVANGHWYWAAALLRECAEKTSGSQEDLEGAIAELGGDFEGTDGYFEQMQINLREGQVRIVFFMDESPDELRSLVDFLNRQMERTEVLIVEARQYRHPDGEQRIVIPSLFGYTEQARRIKKTVTVRARSQPVSDVKEFLGEFFRSHPDSAKAAERLIDGAVAIGAVTEVSSVGNCLFKWTDLMDQSILKLEREGQFVYCKGWILLNESMRVFDEVFRREMTTRTDGRFKFPEKQWAVFKKQEWCPHVEAILESLHKAIEAHRKQTGA